jgi:hypothetical protein
MVMVFRDLERQGPMVTLSEADADACAGFTVLSDYLHDEIRDE